MEDKLTEKIVSLGELTSPEKVTKKLTTRLQLFWVVMSVGLSGHRFRRGKTPL